MTDILTFMGQYSGVLFTNLLPFVFLGAGCLIAGMLVAWLIEIVGSAFERLGWFTPEEESPVQTGLVASTQTSFKIQNGQEIPFKAVKTVQRKFVGEGDI